MTHHLTLVRITIIKETRDNCIFQQDKKNETLVICIVLGEINNLYLKEEIELATTNE